MFRKEAWGETNVVHSASNQFCLSCSLLQSQSITVDRQMRRYDVPRLAFINKCDRSGADPIRVLGQMRDKLKLNCSPVQLPLGLEDKLTGLIDVVEQRAFNFSGPFGNEINEVYSTPCCFKQTVDWEVCLHQCVLWR